MSASYSPLCYQSFTSVICSKIILLALPLVCYTAVFSVVTQRSGGVLRDDTKNGCVADYTSFRYN